MEKAAKKHNVFRQFLEWYLLDQPKLILKAWKNFLWFNLEYFSIPLLLKTFFSPWRRYTWSYGRGFSFKRYLDAFVSNAIFRGLGAVVRLILIVVGIFLEIIIFFAGIIVMITWFLWPLILIEIFVLGFRILF
jgi:hypothetical protein